jgi:hypothetical protein
MDDNRLILLALERVEKKLERLTEDLRKQDAKLDAVEKSANRFQARARRTLAGIFLSAVAAVSWWALGDRITSAVHRGLDLALMANNPKPSATVIEIPVSPRSRR